MFRTIENHHAPKANKSSGFRILPINPYDKLTTNYTNIIVSLANPFWMHDVRSNLNSVFYPF